MLIKEFRVTLPLTVEEYQIGQLFSVAEASMNETGGGEGVEVRRNEPFDNVPLLGGKYTKGQYTYKVYHLQSKVPAIIRKIAPKGSLELHEEAWNAYPYCKTVLTNPDYMKQNFLISIETMHCQDEGDQENVHELTPEQVKSREIVRIDIADSPSLSGDYKESEDPSKFKSTKTGRGPLEPGKWQKNTKPIMTAYKLVRCEFKWFGLQTLVESNIQKTEKRIFHVFHRQLFCWIDRWHGMTMKDIRALEEKVAKELEEQRKAGPVRGAKFDE
ncbi:phosphatidylinositol transfer protein alpha isoform [Galendromus occidentalis]|uniref:Phosphatidylinositol transfer protein alpha isoform n=1 Tax=Galendromus occidentalis TaxID=34638 RepID=A0AAJ6W0A2_9ACAR|nr:phosphatidylinositol transfer protein alpha isoform [Galendromus occidentalis]